MILAFYKKVVLFLEKMQSDTTFQQERTAFCGIIHYAQIHTLGASVERTPLMSDTEAKILELIQGLTLAQQMDVLNRALEMLAAKQEMSPAPLGTSD